MSQIVLRKISKSFQAGRETIHALTGFDLTIASGEFLVLLGPSGSGKTTLLRLITGLELPSKGDLIIDGKTMTGVPAADRSVTMVFQGAALYPFLNVSDNVRFGMKLRKIPASEIESRLQQAVSKLQLKALLNRYPHQLSAGERQRAALARALVLQPRVFLFDEPLSNLDPVSRDTLRRHILQVHHESGSTMIYVTHDQEEAMSFGKPIALLNHGKLEQRGTTDNLYHQPNNLFAARFLGSPPINLFQGIIEKEGDRVLFREKKFGKTRAENGFVVLVPGDLEAVLESWTGSEIWMGVRPEKVLLAGDKTEGKIKARVLSVQSFGFESRLLLGTALHDFTARMATAVDRNKGEVAMELSDIKFFDPKSERLIA